MAVSKDMLQKNLALEYQDGLEKKEKATYKNVKLTEKPEALRTSITIS
ncbi:hypothetical protein ACFLKB_14605 [Clostridium sp. FAM 1755]